MALKRNEKIYIQVSDNITYPRHFQTRSSPLLKIKDAYPKMLIARTKHEDYQYEGIKIVDIKLVTGRIIDLRIKTNGFERVYHV